MNIFFLLILAAWPVGRERDQFVREILCSLLVCIIKSGAFGNFFFV